MGWQVDRGRKLMSFTPQNSFSRLLFVLGRIKWQFLLQNKNHFRNSDFWGEKWCSDRNNYFFLCYPSNWSIIEAFYASTVGPVADAFKHFSICFANLGARALNGDLNYEKQAFNLGYAILAFYFNILRFFLKKYPFFLECFFPVNHIPDV